MNIAELAHICFTAYRQSLRNSQLPDPGEWDALPTEWRQAWSSVARAVCAQVSDPVLEIDRVSLDRAKIGNALDAAMPDTTPAKALLADALTEALRKANLEAGRLHSYNEHLIGIAERSIELQQRALDERKIRFPEAGT